MERFRTTFTLLDSMHHSRRRTVRTKETIAAVERSTKEDPNEPIRHCAQQLICVQPLYGRFCGKILVCVLTKFNSCKNLSHTITEHGVHSVNGPKTR